MFPLKGAILGLDLSVTRGEILKGLLEGIAFEIKLNLEILKQSGCEVKELRLIGGGTRSLGHIQLKADVIGTPITLLDVSEAGCMGVAMLAKAAHNGQLVSQIAKHRIRPVSLVKPKNTSFYDRKFTAFKQLYPVLKNISVHSPNSR
jgi:xylulokinase